MHGVFRKMSIENKVFDIAKFKSYRRAFYDALGTYSRTMLYLQSAYRGFGDMEWKGTIADEVKTIVGTDEIEMSQNISRMLLVFSNELDEIMTSFETDLDSGENARYDVENMTAVDEQVKEYQTASLAIFNSVQDIYDTLTSGFSKYGSYNAPDATAAITSFEELCGNGGTGEDAGFIQNCITKFKTFDEDMTDYLNEMKLKDQIAEIMSILEGKAGSLDADVNASVTANDDYFSKLGWDDYKTNNPVCKYEGIYNEDIRNLIKQYNLTNEQLNYILALESLRGTSKKYSNEKVNSLQMMAAALYSIGKSPEFVASVLGNLMCEGAIGNIENANYSNGDGPFYWVNICNYAKTKGIDFQSTYAGNDNYLYEGATYDEYISFINGYIDKVGNTAIWGCGSFQWTYTNRVEKLFEFYSDEASDGNISYKGLAQAEANMLIYELTDSLSDYSEVDDNFETNYGEKIDQNDYTQNEHIVKSGAVDFYNEYENGSTSTDGERASYAWNIYTVMMQND